MSRKKDPNKKRQFTVRLSPDELAALALEAEDAHTTPVKLAQRILREWVLHRYPPPPPIDQHPDFTGDTQ